MKSVAVGGAVARPRRGAVRAFAVVVALAVATLIVAELLLVDAALAWSLVGMWELPALVAEIVGAVGAAASLWVGWIVFRAALAYERENLEPRQAGRADIVT
ncbi:MAG: hypothetical protein R3F55_16910 [Alphaproteobacteria bacterium]